jgi:hypothetical protein
MDTVPATVSTAATSKVPATASVILPASDNTLACFPTDDLHLPGPFIILVAIIIKIGE